MSFSQWRLSFYFFLKCASDYVASYTAQYSGKGPGWVSGQMHSPIWGGGNFMQMHSKGGLWGSFGQEVRGIIGHQVVVESWETITNPEVIFQWHQCPCAITIIFLLSSCTPDAPREAAKTVFTGSFCNAPCGQDVLLQAFVQRARQGCREPVTKRTTNAPESNGFPSWCWGLSVTCPVTTLSGFRL